MLGARHCITPSPRHCFIGTTTVGSPTMKTLRLLWWLCFVAFAPLAAAADGTLGERLVGVWREYSPSSNVVKFDQDGTTTLYLKKGEIGNLRTLDGKWSVDDAGMLSIVYAVAGKTMTLRARLS